MTTYFTKEPLGSTSPYVLFDNSQNFDYALNDITQTIWKDRFGRNRKTYWGWEQESAAQLLNQQQRFNTFIQSSGYKVIGEYTAGPLTITDYNQLIRYQDAFWKLTATTDIPYTTTGNDAASWVNDSVHFFNVGDGELRQELAAPGGAGLVGGVAKPVTWSGFSGGADPTGVASSDAAFVAADAYGGDVRVEGNFLLTSPVTRSKSVMELPPGSTVTPRKMLGGDTTLGVGIPSKTIFGRYVFRDNDANPISPADSFATHPDMGQLLRMDATQIPGQCAVFLGGNRKLPVIGSKAFVGLHSHHDQSPATKEIWGYNPVVVKNIRASDTSDNISTTIGAEISVSNNTDEIGTPLTTGQCMGLFVSYIHNQNAASAAIATGGLAAGFRNALWLDGVTPDGAHIQLRDEVSGNLGARVGLTTTQVSTFTDGAILVGRGHHINSQNITGGITSIAYVNDQDELVFGQSGGFSRFVSTTVLFNGNISPGTANTGNCGTTGRPWAGGFTQTAFTVTSDEDHKGIPVMLAKGTLNAAALSDDSTMQDAYTDAILDAWAEVDFVQFQYLDRIEEKGADGARWHFGVIAQRAKEAFERHGLDAHRFGFLCYDEWEDQYKQVLTNEGERIPSTRTVKKKVEVTKKRVVQVPVTRTEQRETLIDVVLEDGTKIKKAVTVDVEVYVTEKVYVFNEDGSPRLDETGVQMFVIEPVLTEEEQEYQDFDVIDVSEEITVPAPPVYENVLETPAGSRYGIRYEEALVLEAALQRRNYERLMKQNTELSARVSELERR